MKLSCNVARDLLPLYHDGVCSEDSRTLVKEHVSSCPACRAILQELQREIDIPHESPDDLGAMKKIEDTVEKGKKRAWKRGAAAVLTLVLTLFAGVNVWWYAGTYCYYQQFAGDREPVFDGQDRNSFAWSDGGYDFRVELPPYLTDRGEAAVYTAPEKATKEVTVGQEVRASLFIGRELYAYSVHLTITERTRVPGQAHLSETTTEECVMLDRDLNQVYLDHWDPQLIAYQDVILEQYSREILDIIEAARDQWPFLKD